MKKISLLLILTFCCLIGVAQKKKKRSVRRQPSNFMAAQMAAGRVQTAIKEKGATIASLLSKNDIQADNLDIFLRGFKKEQKLELWAKNKGANTYKLVKVYDFCATSGVLGPKRRSGDRQIPEGFYNVNFFNPWSNYNLSFRIDYPNKSDLKFADQLNPGDNIFIHGHCVTIGCIPVGDDAIQEVYLMAIRAKASGQNIPVHIFPSKMDNSGYAALQNEFSSNATLLDFWANLKTGYDAFDKNNILPTVSVDGNGKYVVK